MKTDMHPTLTFTLLLGRCLLFDLCVLGCRSVSMRCQYMKKSSEGKGGSRTADEGMEKRMDATMDG